MFIALSLLFFLLSSSTTQQTPPIGIIDFYGLRSVTEQQARQAVGLKEGDALPEPWPKFQTEAQTRLQALPNVDQAHVGAVCCEAGKFIIYVGIQERGAPVIAFRPGPKGAARLPADIERAGEDFSAALQTAVLKGEAGDDDSQGHSLIKYPEARAFQEVFITYAAKNLELLRTVLRESADAKDRALSAEIIAYSPKKKEIVKDLVYGTRDPEGNVRNNSVRALALLAKFSHSPRGRGIKVPVEPLVDLLNSLVWTDRNKAAAALLNLTETRDPLVLSILRRRALESLAEMSRWKSPGHAWAPFFILGRVQNHSEAEIVKAWNNGKRDILIEKKALRE
jgi:hypothetical protein